MVFERAQLVVTRDHGRDGDKDQMEKMAANQGATQTLTPRTASVQQRPVSLLPDRRKTFVRCDRFDPIFATTAACRISATILGATMMQLQRHSARDSGSTPLLRGMRSEKGRSSVEVVFSVKVRGRVIVLLRSCGHRRHAAAAA